MGNCRPLFLSHIEGVIVVHHCLVVSSVDDDFVAVGDHVVEGTAVGKGFFCLGTRELGIDLGEGVIELASAISYNSQLLTSKNIDVVSDAAHRVALHSPVRQLKLTANGLPLECPRSELLVDLLLEHRSAGLRNIGSGLLLDLVGDDDVVEAIEAVRNSGVLLVDEPLFLTLESELVFFARLHLNVGNAMSYHYYYSSRPFKWFSTFYMVI